MSLIEIQLKQDRNARNTAVPFRGSIWGCDYGDGTERDLGSGLSVATGASNGDVSELASNMGGTTLSQLVYPIRIIQPHYGEVIASFLDINMSFNTLDNGTQCWLAIGDWSNATQFIPRSSYSRTEIVQSWMKMTGAAAPMVVASGSLTPQTINVQPALYKNTDMQFIPEAFVLLLCFDKAPHAAGFQLNTLNIHMSVQGIK